MNTAKSRILTCCMAGLTAFAVVITPALTVAQVLEEVVVTAQKREQNLQDIGIAITAFSGDQIRKLGFTNTTDIASMTPGLNYTVPNAESSQINFFLRGVGLNDFADANENPVAVYVDDVYRPAMGGLSFQLFDIERVEVLRGPQGSLFGRNTTGGLVHYISQRPTDEFDGYLSLTGGSYSQIKFEGALGGPISDTVSGRISVASNKHDGFTSNRGVGPDYNETDAKAVRGQLLFTPSDRFDALVSAYYSDNDAAVGAWQHQATKFNANGESVPLGPNEQDTSVDCNANGISDPGDARPAPGTDCFGYRDTDGDPFAGEYDRDGKVEVESSGISVNLNWHVGELTVTSITSFQSVDRLQSEDTEAGPFPLILPTFRAKTDTFTQELRVAGQSDAFRWLAGVYYFDNEVDGEYDLDLTNLGFIFFDADFTQTTESLAFFGQIEFDLSDNWTFIVGARGATEKKELDYLNVDTADFYTGIIGLPTNVAFEFNTSTVGDLAKHDNTSFNGKVELDWKPTNDLLIYGSVSRGTKSAGFNVGFLDETFIFASNTSDTIPFDEETLTSFEAGFKSTFGGGHTRLNGSVFYYDYKDFQTFRFELLNQVIFNTDAEVFGLELELQSSPTEGLDLAVGLSLLDATAKNIPSPLGGFREREMVAAPDFAVNALIRYQWPVFNGHLAVQAWANYQKGIYYDIQNVPVSFEDGYTVTNLRASYTSGGERWELAAFVYNLTEEEYLSYTFDFTGVFGFNQQAYGPPRWVGVTLQYNFQ